MRTCQKCGAEVEKDDKYCPECGEKVVKEARTITVWSIVKILFVIIFFVILLNLFKSKSGASPVLVLIVAILFIVWSGVLNWFLQKLFNAKISTGVKIAISIAMFVILFFGASMATKTSTPMISKVAERSPIGEAEVELYNVVGKINSAFSYKNDNILTGMVEKGELTKEVFEDLKNVISQSGSITMSLTPYGTNFLGTHAEVNTEVLLRRGDNERRTGVVLVFEKRDATWTLIKISPRLTDIKIEEPFEEAVKEKEQLKVKVIPGEGYY